MTETKSGYIHGSSPEERRRLSLLNDILNTACLSEVQLCPGNRVLDVGSGLGQFTRLMAQTVGSGGSVVGIEADEDQIASAQDLAAEEEEAGLVEFRQGDALALPLSEAEWGGFDVAHARFLLEHVERPERVIAQMVRAVRPGGRVIVVDDDHGDFRPWPEPPGFPALWAAYVRSYERKGNDPYVGRHLVALLHGAGLTAFRNTSVFFGGAGGTERFQAIADNLIAALAGAESEMLQEGLGKADFDAGLKALEDWAAAPSSALWYSACYAEGVVPD